MDMKCKKCSRMMERKGQTGNSYYYECPVCHYSIGKKQEVIEDGGQKEQSDEREPTGSQLIRLK